ncbi:rubrerythrin-like domain-containing protein [Halorhabdus utahensis]
MVRSDPYTPSTYRLECRSCLTVLRRDDRIGQCPECGGRLRNLAIPRE